MIDSLRQALNRVRAFLEKEPIDQDLEAKINSHLGFAIEEKIQHGMSADEARRQALARLGGVEQAKEEHRSYRCPGVQHVSPYLFPEWHQRHRARHKGNDIHRMDLGGTEEGYAAGAPS